MIKAIGKLAKGIVKVGKPIAGLAIKETIENAVPGGDLGLDVTKAVLGSVLRKKPDEAMDEFTRRIDEAEPEQIKELVMDVLTLSELVRAAQEDGKLSETEKVLILNAVEELREESEALLGLQ